MKQTDLTVGLVVAIKGPGYNYNAINLSYPKYGKAKVLTVGTGSGPRHLVEDLDTGKQESVSSKAILGVWGEPYESAYRKQKDAIEAKNKQQFAKEFQLEMMNERAQGILPMLAIFGGLEEYEDDIVICYNSRLSGTNVIEPMIRMPLSAVERIVEKLKEGYKEPWL